MLEIDPLEDDSGGTVFRDVIMLVLAGFVVIVLLLLPHINPPAVAAKQSMDPPGNVMVEIRWPDELDSDVDLWVQAPGDTPVGYSNKGGNSFNLLRDDRGHLRDASNLNYEVSYSRGMPAGEYVINLHLYNSRSQITAPISVDVVVSVRRTPTAPARQIVSGKALLRQVGDEITAFRFKLDGKGHLVTDSVHNIFKPLRSEKS
ncbi:MAG: hypothetical protein HOA58_13680 [Rhodospirillaceae bacterium]|jgi:hypothetical protein|nr:hypothetical protein [Rhodospirillaceae bacterium]MBT3927409.1 hypothetical protein [Rhodospirillaceae bacterium]MBT5780588.1 hypothetical protein [Rhodospirillaceae bacterium]MBT6830562.1 hypothetical protein [Rhodospirillaceae bacterium]MBT7293731.1 hypothetical protein [Rhodospirillaceae bacterium]